MPTGVRNRRYQKNGTSEIVTAARNIPSNPAPHAKLGGGAEIGSWALVASDGTKTTMTNAEFAANYHPAPDEQTEDKGR